MYNENNNQPGQTTQTSEPLHWKPQSNGDAVVGILIRAEKVKVYGKRLRAAIIREDDGREWSVLLSYKLLEAKWNELSPDPGMHVEITYLGDRESRWGKLYKLFELTVKDPISESDEKRQRPFPVIPIDQSG